MTNKSLEISKSIQDKNIEIHYNSKHIRNQDGQLIHINMHGKIRCPILNEQISSVICSKIMDKEGWPRAIDPDICKKCDCYINLSIAKFKELALAKNKEVI